MIGKFIALKLGVSDKIWQISGLTGRVLRQTMNNIKAIQDEIRRMHGCESRHMKSELVSEEAEGQTVWVGVVEVFELIGHPEAKICYGWGDKAGDEDEKMRYVTVLEIPPIDSPLAAVRVSIISDSEN